MAYRLCLLWVAMTLVLGVAGCGIFSVAPGEPEIRKLAWQSLEPNTHSHNEANWEFIEVKLVIGSEVTDLFEDRHAACPGPAFEPNKQINPSASYWYVHMAPIKATPLPGQISPTTPPNIPEPYIVRALFLLDDDNGRVIARALDCVIY